MAGRDEFERVIEQQLQRLDIRFHIAARRNYDYCGTVHDVITGKQHALFLKEVAIVVTDMPGRVDRAQREFVRRQALIVRDGASIDECRVLESVILDDIADQFGAGCRGYGLRRGRVIAMGVGDKDPAQPVPDRFNEGFDM